MEVSWLVYRASPSSEPASLIKDSIILSITDLVFLEFYLIVTIVLQLFAPAYDVVIAFRPRP